MPASIVSSLEVEPHATRDDVTVDGSGRRVAPGIEGVVVEEGKWHVDHRGALAEVVNLDSPLWVGIATVNVQRWGFVDSVRSICWRPSTRAAPVWSPRFNSATRRSYLSEPRDLRPSRMTVPRAGTSPAHTAHSSVRRIPVSKAILG